MIPCKGLEENDFLSGSTCALPGAQGLSPMRVMNLCFRRGNMESHLIVKELSSSSPQHCQRNNRNPGLQVRGHPHSTDSQINLAGSF